MAPASGQNSFGVNRNTHNKTTSRICHGAATPSFGLLAHVSCWGPLWTWLGGHARPNHHIISSHRYIRVRVLLVLVFLVKLRLIHYNCGDKSFYSDPGPSFLISSTMSIIHLELSSWTPLVIRFIHICNIRLCVYIFLLVFFDSLAGKAFLARSIVLCTVDD